MDQIKHEILLLRRNIFSWVTDCWSLHYDTFARVTLSTPHPPTIPTLLSVSLCLCVPTYPVMLLEFHWGPSTAKQEALQQKCRALHQSSLQRVEEIKAKRALAKAKSEGQGQSQTKTQSALRPVISTKPKGAQFQSEDKSSETSCLITAGGSKQERPKPPLPSKYTFWITVGRQYPISFCEVLFNLISLKSILGYTPKNSVVIALHQLKYLKGLYKLSVYSNYSA